MARDWDGVETAAGCPGAKKKVNGDGGGGGGARPPRGERRGRD